MSENWPVANEDSLTKDGFQSDIRAYLQFPFGDATMSFAGVVDDSAPGPSGEPPTRGRGFCSMAKLAKKCPEGYADLTSFT